MATRFMIVPLAVGWNAYTPNFAIWCTEESRQDRQQQRTS